MRQRTELEELMVRFLLGELSEQERSRIEERFLSDNVFFEQLLAVEQALIDDHVQGRLSPVENDRLEAMIGSSRVQASELESARSLIDQVLQSNPLPTLRPSRRRSLFSYLYSGPHARQFAVAGLILTAAVAGCLLMWSLHLQNQLRQVEESRRSAESERDQLLREREEEARRNDELGRLLASRGDELERIERELAELQAGSKSEIGISLESDSMSRGGGELKSVRLYPAARRINFRLTVAPVARLQAYDATIRSFDGRKIGNGEVFRARPSGAAIMLAVPATLFVSDDYIITLKGRSDAGESVDLGDFPFRVKR